MKIGCPRRLPITSYLITTYGDHNAEGRRGILMNGAYLAVIDSYISEFKQRNLIIALASYNGSGPFRIANNYLEAAGENVLFGGADSAAPSLVPADIEIIRNHFAKPLALIGSGYVVKNLLEFKAAKRALVLGNILENNPAASQSGFALLVTPRNQDRKPPLVNNVRHRDRRKYFHKRREWPEHSRKG